MSPHCLVSAWPELLLAVKNSKEVRKQQPILTAQSQLAYHLVTTYRVKIHHSELHTAVTDLLPGNIKLKCLIMQKIFLKTIFNERKLVLGATHVKVKVKVKVQIKKLRNIGVLP